MRIARICCDVSVNYIPRGALGTRGTNTTSRSDCFQGAFDLLKVFVAKLAVVPAGWAVFRGVVGDIKLARGPDQLEWISTAT